MKKFVLFALNCTYFPTVSFTSETPSETASNVAAAASFIFSSSSFLLLICDVWRIIVVLLLLNLWLFLSCWCFPLKFDIFFFSSSRTERLPFLPKEEKSKSQERVKNRGNSSQLSLYRIQRERERVCDDVNVNDKYDGRQTKCVYLLFRFFFFLGLLLFLFQTRDRAYFVLGDVFDSSHTSL